MSANNHRLKSINFPVSFTPHIFNSITQQDLIAGQQQDIVLTPTLPENVIPFAGFLITNVETISDNTNTTGLNASVGISGTESGYILFTDIIGDAGIKPPTQLSGSPTLFGFPKINAPTILQLTAIGGGSENLLDISQLDIRVVIYYIDISKQIPTVP